MANGEKGAKSTPADQRRKRQADALRANLAKRKAQARGRAQAHGGHADEGEKSGPAERPNKH